MKSYFIIFVGLFFSMALPAEDGKISFNLILTPLSSIGIQVDSTKLILYNSDSSAIKQVSMTADTVVYLFDSLDVGKYYMTVQLYQKDYILTENLSGGYISDHEYKEILGSISFECAYPILHVNWNPGIILDGNDFYDFAIDPDSNFLKRYYLNNLDSLSTAFRDSGLHYYNQYPVHWHLLDSNLIPIINYSFGDYRNPVTTCHTAFAFYDEYRKNKDSLNFTGFKNNVNWLSDNCDSNYYLHYEFDFSHQGEQLPAGWVSGMAQGLALAALSMAYHLTNEQKYLDGAQGIFTTMYKNSENYFCIGVDEEDYYWLEEYPCSRFCHVLNGMVSGLWGLWCYYAITGNNFTRALLEAGIKSVVDNYPQWNCANQDLSYYCLHHNTNINYHKKHIDQLNFFGDYFNVPELHHASDCFSNKYFAAYPSLIKCKSDKCTSEIVLFSTLNWSVNSDNDWLTFQQTDNKLNISCSDNLYYESRTAYLSFTESVKNILQTIQITQDPATIYLLSDTDTISVSSDSGLVWFEVDMATDWTAACNNQWVETYKMNDTILSIKYPENTLSKNRTANLEVYSKDSSSNQVVTILQDHSPIYLALRPDSIWVSANSGEVEICIEASDNWEITYDTAWIKAYKINDTLLLLKYLKNPDFFNPRVTCMTIYLTDSLLTSEFKIRQLPAPHYLSVYPDSVTVTADSGYFEINVQSSVIWNAISSDPWLQTYQQGDTLLSVYYQINNTYENRNAVITISLNDTLSKIIKITQLANTEGINIHADKPSLDIFPNPAHDEIHLRFILNKKVPVNIEVFDVSGRLVSQPFNNWLMPAEHDITLDLSGWEKGLYLVRFRAGKKIITKEIVVF